MGHWGCFLTALAEPAGKPSAWCIWGTSWCSQLYLPKCWASKLPLWFGIASFPSPSVHCGGEWGYSQGAQGDTDVVSLQGILALMNSSSLVHQKLWTILRTCLRQWGYPLRVSQYRALYFGSYSTAPLLASSLSVDSWTWWIFWCMAMGRVSLWEGKQLRWSANTISLPGLYWMALSIAIHLHLSSNLDCAAAIYHMTTTCDYLWAAIAFTCMERNSFTLYYPTGK